MINLLPQRNNTENSSVNKIKHVVYLFTHISLIAYVLFVAGTSALMLRNDQTQNQLNSDILSLESQLKTFSNIEAMVLHLDRTQKNIDKFKSERPKLAEYVQNLNTRPTSLVINNWDYKKGGTSRISVESQNQFDLEEYTKLLKLKFTKLQLEQTVTKGGTWSSILTLK